MARANMKISIVIPAYNVENYISSALDSVMQQTPPFDEIIIVNDGSTDHTGQIIAEHPCHMSATVITQENRGLGPARNVGAARATGDYIYYFDSDDVLDASFTRVIHTCIDNHGAPDLILFGGKQFPDGEGVSSELKDFDRGPTAHGLDSQQVITELAPRKRLYAPAQLYISQRRLWGEDGLQFQPILHEDEEIIYRLVLAAGDISVLADKLYHRRVRPGSIMSSGKRPAHAAGLLVVTRSMLQLYESQDDHRSPVARQLRRRTIRHACRYIRTCHKVDIVIDRRKIARCAITLKSVSIMASMIGVTLKQAITWPLRRPKA